MLSSYPKHINKSSKVVLSYYQSSSTAPNYITFIIVNSNLCFSPSIYQVANAVHGRETAMKRTTIARANQPMLKAGGRVPFLTSFAILSFTDLMDLIGP
jgi:hypothetical protein